VVLLISAMFSLSGCGGESSGADIVYADKQSKSSIEISRVLSGLGSSSPMVKLTVKNISAEQVEIGTLNKFRTFSIQVISTAKNGQSLSNSYASLGFLPLKLQPKEMRSGAMGLFPSDETNGCRIVVSYKSLPEIAGAYIETAQAAGKFSVNHYIDVAGVIESEQFPYVAVDVKNISSGAITGGSKNGQRLYERINEKWFVNVRYKDAGGNYLSSEEMYLAGPDSKLEPGQVRKFDQYKGFNYRPRYPSKTSSYEITITTDWVSSLDFSR
jgi:hypothetical protein